MKRFLKILGYLLLSVIGIILIVVVLFNAYYGKQNSRAKKLLAETNVLNEGGFEFRDLNKNGKLDVYEDYRQDVEKRIDDLLLQMTIEEKVGLMWHPPIGVGKNGEVLNKPNPAALSMVSSLDVIVNKKINHYNLFKVLGAKNLAEWNNAIQKIAEKTRLGIPISISSDPRHGINNFIGMDMLGGQWSKWAEPIGLAATGDSALVVESREFLEALPEPRSGDFIENYFIRDISILRNQS